MACEQKEKSTVPPARPITLSEARKYSNCSHWNGAVDAVKRVAEGQGYLHNFEYDRLHPCCLVKNTKIDQTYAPLSSNDFVFVVVTSSKTPLKAKGVLDTWGSGLENLLLISDTADPELPPGTITPAGAAAAAAAAANDAAGTPTTVAPGSGGQSGGAGGSGVGLSIKQALDEQHTQIWGVKYLSASPEYARLKEKKWFVIADDDTWINIPALIDFAAKYDSRCPVVFGYVWSKIWSDHDSDYHSGSAGLLMSQEAFLQIAPSFYTPECPFHHYNDITFGRCAWSKSVQLVHNRGFFYDPPERSKDRHSTVWLPPVAEALTYHYVHPAEMQLMTNYVNQRWQYEPARRGNFSNFLAVSQWTVAHTDWVALARKYDQKAKAEAATPEP